MFNNWFRKERPIQGMMGMGGGTTGYLAGGGVAGNPPLYDWTAGTSYTFTADSIPAGALGSPDSAIYGNPNYTGSGFRNGGRHLFSTVEHDHTSNWRGVIKLVIPEDGVYELSARGAAGGSSGSTTGGRGSYCTTRGPLLGGDIILMVVGKEGITQPYCGGGGGGTFVWHVGNYWDNGGSGMNYSYDSRTLQSIICAGGGGGGAHGSPYSSPQGDGVDGSTNIFGTRSKEPTNGSSGATSGPINYNLYRRQAAGYAGQIDWGAPNARNFEGGGGAGFMSRTTSPSQPNQTNPMTWMSIPETYAFPGPNPNFGAFNSPHNSTFTFQGNQPSNAPGSGYPGNSGGPSSEWGDGPTRQGRQVTMPAEYHRAFHGGAGSSPPGGPNSPVNRNDGGFGGGGGGSTGCGGSGAGGGFSGGMNSGCYAVSGAGGIYGRDSAEGFAGWSRQNTGVYSSRQSGEITIQRIS